MIIQQKEEFSLSLSLSFPGSSDHEHKLTNTNNINNQTAYFSSSQELNLKPSSTTDPFPRNSTLPPHSPGPKVETCRLDRRRLLTGIDVNRSLTGDVEDKLGLSSPNSTLSSLSGNKRSLIREVANGEDVMERSRSEDQEDGDYCRKKLRLSKDQAAILEESFKEHNTLNPKQKIDLGKRLGLRPRQVEVWFQNRRARTKLKQTAVDCVFLKRCCQILMEENKKLQNEVQELRAFNLSPQFSAQMIPPTSLTICLSCGHFAVPSSATTSSVCPSTTKAEPPQKQKIDLGKRLCLRPRQVEVWFQNRRARTKLKQTAVDCVFLKRCCQTLVEENKKLQIEVQELRAFSLSRFSAQMIPPTSLTICPSCGHFAVPSSATTSSVCPSTTKAEPPQVHAMSTITLDFVSTCAPPGLDRENQRAQTLFL